MMYIYICIYIYIYVYGMCGFYMVSIIVFFFFLMVSFYGFYMVYLVPSFDSKALVDRITSQLKSGGHHIAGWGNRRGGPFGQWIMTYFWNKFVDKRIFLPFF